MSPINNPARIPHIWVDADACPVTGIVIHCAKQACVPVTLVCDSAHEMQREGAETLVVSQGADSADFALVNRIAPGDIVITQDYGLAAMCLARNAQILHPNGFRYTDENIGGLLLSRHTAKKIRNGGGRIKGPPKRTRVQDEEFERALLEVLGEVEASGGPLS